MKENAIIPDESLLYLSAWASRAMISDLNRRFHEAGLRLTMEQWRALSFLCDGEGLTQNDLAALLLQEKTSVSRLLTGMQRRGYVTRLSHARDGRCNHLLVTQAGREIFQKGASLARMTMHSAGHGVASEEMDSCRRVLIQIIHNLCAPPHPKQSHPRGAGLSSRSEGPSCALDAGRHPVCPRR